MKFLIFSMLLFAARTHASGCIPYDVQLYSEDVVATLGTFEVSPKCDQHDCDITVHSNDRYEWHVLYQLEGREKIPQQKAEVKIYRQYFESSCSELVRYTLGLEINGKRFRSEKDLEML